jgi:hypothetical protein
MDKQREPREGTGRMHKKRRKKQKTVKFVSHAIAIIELVSAHRWPRVTSSFM